MCILRKWKTVCFQITKYDAEDKSFVFVWTFSLAMESAEGGSTMGTLPSDRKVISRTWDSKIPSEHQCWEIWSGMGCLELLIVGIV